MSGGLGSRPNNGDADPRNIQQQNGHAPASYAPQPRPAYLVVNQPINNQQQNVSAPFAPNGQVYPHGLSGQPLLARNSDQGPSYGNSSRAPQPNYSALFVQTNPFHCPPPNIPPQFGQFTENRQQLPTTNPTGNRAFNPQLEYNAGRNYISFPPSVPGPGIQNQPQGNADVYSGAQQSNTVPIVRNGTVYYPQPNSPAQLNQYAPTNRQGQYNQTIQQTIRTQYGHDLITTGIPAIVVPGPDFQSQPQGRDAFNNGGSQGFYIGAPQNGQPAQNIPPSHVTSHTSLPINAYATQYPQAPPQGYVPPNTVNQQWANGPLNQNAPVFTHPAHASPQPYPQRPFVNMPPGNHAQNSLNVVGTSGYGPQIQPNHYLRIGQFWQNSPALPNSSIYNSHGNQQTQNTPYTNPQSNAQLIQSRPQAPLNVQSHYQTPNQNLVSVDQSNGQNLWEESPPSIEQAEPHNSRTEQSGSNIMLNESANVEVNLQQNVENHNSGFSDNVEQDNPANDVNSDPAEADSHVHEIIKDKNGKTILISTKRSPDHHQSRLASHQPNEAENMIDNNSDEKDKDVTTNINNSDEVSTSDMNLHQDTDSTKDVSEIVNQCSTNAHNGIEVRANQKTNEKTNVSSSASEVAMVTKHSSTTAINNERTTNVWRGRPPRQNTSSGRDRRNRRSEEWNTRGNFTNRIVFRKNLPKIETSNVSKSHGQQNDNVDVCKKRSWNKEGESSEKSEEVVEKRSVDADRKKSGIDVFYDHDHQGTSQQIYDESDSEEDTLGMEETEEELETEEEKAAKLKKEQKRENCRRNRRQRYDKKKKNEKDLKVHFSIMMRKIEMDEILREFVEKTEWGGLVVQSSQYFSERREREVGSNRTELIARVADFYSQGLNVIHIVKLSAEEEYSFETEVNLLNDWITETFGPIAETLMLLQSQMKEHVQPVDINKHRKTDDVQACIEYIERRIQQLQMCGCAEYIAVVPLYETVKENLKWMRQLITIGAFLYQAPLENLVTFEEILFPETKPMDILKPGIE